MDNEISRLSAPEMSDDSCAVSMCGVESLAAHGKLRKSDDSRNASTPVMASCYINTYIITMQHCNTVAAIQSLPNLITFSLAFQGSSSYIDHIQLLTQIHLVQAIHISSSILNDIQYHTIIQYHKMTRKINLITLKYPKVLTILISKELK